MSENLNIHNGIEELIALHQLSGLKGSWKRFRNSPKILKNLMFNLLLSEKLTFDLIKFTDSRIKNTVCIPTSPFTSATMSKVDEMKDSLPLNQIREAVVLFEGRHQKHIANIAVFVSGLLGGIIGAMGSLLLK